MKPVVLLIAMIGYAVATPPIVTTLYSDLNRNTLHIQNGPIGGRISAELPSLGSVAPILSQLAPLALSLGNLGSLGDLSSLGELASLGARLLPSLPSAVSLRTVPVSIPIPFPSFTPITYSAQSLVPYPYGVYAGARFF